MEAVNPTTNVCFFADNVSFVTIFLYARASHPIVASYFYNTMFGSMSICCSGRLLSWQQLTDPSSQWGAHAGMGSSWLASVWWTKTLLSANCISNSVNCVQHFQREVDFTRHKFWPHFQDDRGGPRSWLHQQALPPGSGWKTHATICVRSPLVPI